MKEWRFVLFLIILIEMCTSLSVFAAMNDTKSVEILEWILRRQLSPDIYKVISSSSFSTCHSESSTHLIGEKQCVRDQDIFNGKVI